VPFLRLTSRRRFSLASFNTLQKDELSALFKTAATVKAVEKNGMAYTMIDATSYKVNDRTVLSKYIFTCMGWNNVWLEFGQAKGKENLVAYLGEYKNAEGEIHYAIYDIGGKCIWMYHQEDYGIKPQTMTAVYVRSAK